MTTQVTIDIQDNKERHFEVVLLQCLIKYGERAYSKIAEILRPEHFSSSDAPIVYEAIKRQFEDGASAIDLELLYKDVREHLDHDVFENMESVYVNLNGVEEYANIIIEAYKRRQINAKLIEIINTVNDSSMSDKEASDISTYVQNAVSDFEVSDDVFIKDAIITANDYIAKFMNNRDEVCKVIPTGIDDIDSIIGGGLFPGTLNIIGARPGVGKSALGTQMLINMLRSCWDYKAEALHTEMAPMLIFSLEMDAVQVIQRIFSSFAKISVSDIRQNALSQSNWASITRESVACFSHKGRNPRLLICEKASVTIADIKAYVTALSRKYGGLSCIMVDYLQLVTVDTKGKTRAQALGEVSKELKEIARTYDIPVIAQCQLRREVDRTSQQKNTFSFVKMPEPEDEAPQNSDIKDSGSIEQDADFIMMLKKKSRSDIVTAYITKNRNGAGGSDVSVDLLFDGKACSFHSAKDLNDLDWRA